MLFRRAGREAMKERALPFEEVRPAPAPQVHGAQPFRLAEGGLIDRGRTLSFRFDRRVYQGHPGDTLASALLANGVRLVARSFKYHRPRGILSAGSEEPSALVQLGEGARFEPNTRATLVELHDGLVAFSQNRWPTLAFDLMAANALLAPIFPAGFYYKTFMWPAAWWEPLYERLIRRAAGLGKGPRAPDPDRYEKRHAHCDVLVVGAGPAGLAAALAAGHAGARVVLADENPRLGGRLLSERLEIDGRPGIHWAGKVEGELESLPEITLLPRTTAVGYYDDNLIVLVEQPAGPAADPWSPRQRLWTVRAREVVLATGAIERPLVFPGNDRPGVMLAGAVRTYLNRFAVAPGRRAVVLAGCDDAWRIALDLAAAGVEVAAIIDPRGRSEGPLALAARGAGIEVLPGHVVGRTFGRLGLSAVEVAPLADGKAPRRIECDLCAVSGGWQPALHLHSQTGVRPVWDVDLRAFRPGPARQRERSAGAAAGHMTLASCLETGFRAGAEAAEAAGFRATLPPVPACSDDEVGPIAELWSVPQGRGRGKAFVDLQDDVTEGDVALAHREGYRSVEHLKRYTTLGMGTDQGKTANLAGLALLAGLRGDEIATVGTTTFRPPFVPVSLGAIAGREIGAHFKPVRRTPMRDWHAKAGAEWIDAALWVRPRYYPKPGEDLLAASLREARAVRERVGLVDVSTLGKIEVQGPDAAELLSRLYCNHVERLPVGKARYGLMLREDGMVLDDGTVSRLSDDLWYVTTTTAHAARILAHMEFHRQAVWPDLAAEITDVTEQLAGIALAGPRSRAVLARAVDGADVSDAALPFMGVAEARIAGCPVLLLRISFSGELAYEIHTPSGHGTRVWEALMAVGEAEGIVPYGTEAMGMLRLEKGHVAGAELDGRTTPADLGLGRFASRKKDYVGRAALERPALLDPDRLRLVGLVPEDGRTPIRPGAQIVDDPAVPAPVPSLGHVTSADVSPMLDKPIALALVSGGLGRKGQTLHAMYPLRGETAAAVVTDPVFFDPEGRRLHG
jgi:heterotetrameric sarcosine oxidase alpha subunit